MKTTNLSNPIRGDYLHPVTGLLVKGFIGELNKLIYYTDGQDVFRAPFSNVVDTQTGYLQGRWECSVAHWNRHDFARMGLPKVS